jgi:hypothetical protein
MNVSNVIKITKKEFYALGGIQNEKLFRKAVGKRTKYYKVV